MYCKVKLLFVAERRMRKWGWGKKDNITLAIINWRNYDVNENKQEMPRALITAVCNSLIRKHTHTPLYTQAETHGYKLHTHTSLTGTHIRRMMKHSVIVNIAQRWLSAFHMGV